SAFSLASSPAQENRSSRTYVQNLPAEVRASLRKYTKACGDELTAASGFSRFIDVGRLRLIALHFHDLRCVGRDTFCDSGKCLHQVYMSHGGRYHLVMSVQANEITLTSLDTTPAIEVEYDHGRQRTWRWSGNRFVDR
ncbi:MAG: hypothetical protein J0H57_26290, partial [Rhodospirillales bacterium]|nr:hypothetical protein [Rhodospirillales bacterium]